MTISAKEIRLCYVYIGAPRNTSEYHIYMPEISHFLGQTPGTQEPFLYFHFHGQKSQ